MMWSTITKQKNTHDLRPLEAQHLVHYEKHFFSDGCAWPWAATSDKYLRINSRNDEPFVVERVSPPLARMHC